MRIRNIRNRKKEKETKETGENMVAMSQKLSENNFVKKDLEDFFLKKLENNSKIETFVTNWHYINYIGIIISDHLNFVSS